MCVCVCMYWFIGGGGTVGCGGEDCGFMRMKWQMFDE